MSRPPSWMGVNLDHIPLKNIEEVADYFAKRCGRKVGEWAKDPVRFQLEGGVRWYTVESQGTAMIVNVYPKRVYP